MLLGVGEFLAGVGAWLKAVLVPMWLGVGTILAIVAYRRLGRRGAPRSSAWWLLAGAYLILGPMLARIQLAWSPADALARGLLAILHELAPLLSSPWTLVVGIILIFLGPVVPDLRTVLTGRLRSVSVGTVRLELGPETGAVALVISQPSAAEGLAEMTPYGELAGSEGPVLEQPAVPDPTYAICLSALPSLFAELSDVNQGALAQRLRELEHSWRGEYAEELGLSARYLGYYAARNQVLLHDYLAKTLIFRHLMLLYHGRSDAARDLVRDLQWIEAEQRRRFLTHESSIRVAVGLTQQRDWESAAELALWPEREGLEIQRAALTGYLSIVRGKGESADRESAVQVGDNDWGPHAALAMVVQAEAALVTRRPMDAVAPARRVLSSPLPRDRGVGRGLRIAAARTLARACLHLGMGESLYELYASPETSTDPDVLNTLAVHAARQGHHEQACLLLRQAAAGLGPQSPAGLSSTIQENLRYIERRS